MKKFSTFIGVLLIAIALVSCKPGYTPVGADGFTETQQNKITELQKIGLDSYNIAYNGYSQETQSIPEGMTFEESVTATLDSPNSEFYGTSTFSCNDKYAVPEAVDSANIKYNISMKNKQWFVKDDGKTVYTLQGLIDKGAVDAESGDINEDVMNTLITKTQMEATVTVKNTTGKEAVIQTLKYNVVLSMQNKVITFDSGSLSVDLGDGKGAIGSSDAKDISSYFETPVGK